MHTGLGHDASQRKASNLHGVGDAVHRVNSNFVSMSSFRAPRIDAPVPACAQCTDFRFAG
ncbi:hypothetical protein DIE16_04810 [Burkholderia sp. Bp9090]|nr:hypothetical protein DIE01_00315 [Burkholderia sp. Bp8990]RQZ41850.1 hypothetical protein DIE16_04810 [Burkholderia sp. Bp9090]